VRKGDTLLRIALDFGQNYRDLVTWNNLADPDDIKVGQVLRVAPPSATARQRSPAPIRSRCRAPTSRPAVPPKKTTPRGDKKPYTKAPGRFPEGRQSEPSTRKPSSAPSGAWLAAGSTVTATDDEKLSWMWPSNGKIIATFDEGKNKGIDIAGRLGQQVMAAGPGK
jgi:lipoprotein NlpD